MKNLWDSLTLPNKCLILIGFFALFQNIITIFYDSHSTNPADVAIRSVMSSIFGFIFGAQTVENNHLINEKTQTLIAGSVALLALFVVIASHWANIDQANASIVELRNLMFTAVGFLLSRADKQE